MLIDDAKEKLCPIIRHGTAPCNPVKCAWWIKWSTNKLEGSCAITYIHDIAAVIHDR